MDLSVSVSLDQPHNSHTLSCSFALVGSSFAVGNSFSGSYYSYKSLSASQIMTKIMTFINLTNTRLQLNSITTKSNSISCSKHKWESWPPATWDCSSFQQLTNFSLLWLPTFFAQTIPKNTWTVPHYYINTSPLNVRLFYILCFLGAYKCPEPVKSPNTFTR